MILLLLLPSFTVASHRVFCLLLLSDVFERLDECEMGWAS